MALIDNLKPEIKALMEQDKEKYPHSYESLLKSLNEVEFIFDLPLGKAIDLVNYFNDIPDEVKEEKWGFKNSSFLLKLYEAVGK